MKMRLNSFCARACQLSNKTGQYMSDHADTIIQKQYRKGFLSMRAYVRPMMMSEAFAPNEYIAACYTLVCAIPGSSATEIGDGTATRYFNGADGFGRYRYTMWDGNKVYADGLAHGNCGNESTSYDVDHSIGYEHNNDGTVKNAVISNVHIGTQSGNSNMYYAHWQSDNGTLYTHYGFAIMDANPNHS